MRSSDAEKSQISYARFAGFMFLFDNIAYLLGIVITSRFRVSGNFAETAHRIMGAGLLYRFGLCSMLVGGLCTVFLAIGLYGVVKLVDHNLALLALVFRVAEAALRGAVSILGFSALKLYIDPSYRNAFDATQLSALVNLHSAAGVAGYHIADMFFGMGSILFFYLFFKTSYIPKILSGFGLLASALVPIIYSGSLLSLQNAKMLQFGWIPIAVAEFTVGAWLLFKGINVRTASAIGS